MSQLSDFSPRLCGEIFTVTYYAIPMPTRTLAWIVFFVLLTALAFRVQGLYARASTDAVTREQFAYRQVRETIRDRYVNPVDDKKLFYGAMEGMVSTLDPNSHFISPEDFEAQDAHITGVMEGVGMEIDQDTRGIFVITPWRGTPAFEHGVLPGDRLLKIDDISTVGMDSDEARRRIVGTAGTVVKLALLHEGGKNPVELLLTRAPIVAPSIQVAEILNAEWVPDPALKIGYVLIAQFQSHTPDDLDAALKKLEGQGMQALILDLRQNRGGMLDTATGVAELFLKDGLIVTVSERSEHSGRITEELHTSSGKRTHPDYPIVVLVDSISASASEIVSGALRERGRATLVGGRTYGKFSVQTIIHLTLPGTGMAALKLTTGRYKTPVGKCIDGEGIVPDVIVPSTAEQQKALVLYRNQRHIRDNNPRKSDPEAPPRRETFVDLQLKKAVETIMGKMK